MWLCWRCWIYRLHSTPLITLRFSVVLTWLTALAVSSSTGSLLTLMAAHSLFLVAGTVLKLYRCCLAFGSGLFLLFMTDLLCLIEIRRPCGTRTVVSIVSCQCTYCFPETTHWKLTRHYSRFCDMAFCYVHKFERACIYPGHDVKLHPHRVKL